MLTRLLSISRQPTSHLTRLSLFHAMSTATSSPRTYAGAIEALNSLQSNAATINAIRASGNKQDSVQNDHSIEYLRRIGYEVSRAAGPVPQPGGALLGPLTGLAPANSAVAHPSHDSPPPLATRPPSPLSHFPALRTERTQRSSHHRNQRQRLHLGLLLVPPPLARARSQGRPLHEPAHGRRARAHQDQRRPDRGGRVCEVLLGGVGQVGGGGQG